MDARLASPPLSPPAGVVQSVYLGVCIFFLVVNWFPLLLSNSSFLSKLCLPKNCVHSSSRREYVSEAVCLFPHADGVGTEESVRPSVRPPLVSTCCCPVCPRDRVAPSLRLELGLELAGHPSTAPQHCQTSLEKH